MAKLKLTSTNARVHKSFLFTQDQLDEGEDFTTVVDWLVRHPDKAHGMIGTSEYHELTLVHDHRGWSILVDGEEANEFTGDGVNVVRDWVEATIERADWDFSEHAYSIDISLTLPVTVRLRNTTVDFKGEVPGISARLDFDRDALEEQITEQICATLLREDAFTNQANEVESVGSWAQIGFANSISVEGTLV
jgi:hypothetical protein